MDWEVRARALIDEYLHGYVHLLPKNDVEQPFIIHDRHNCVSRCALCSIGWMTSTRIEEHHIRDNVHRKVLRMLCGVRDDKWSKTQLERELHLDGFQERANALGYDKWTWHVGHLLNSYMTCRKSQESNCLAQVTDTLEKYEKMEKTLTFGAGRAQHGSWLSRSR